MKSESFSQKSATHSLRLTRNQQAVLDTLHQQADALSAQELYRLLRERQAIGLATIYRALETLKMHGLIKSRMCANGEALYSSVVSDQHYLTCLQCGQSFPLDYCPVQELESHLQASVQFKVYYHTLEFFGICEPCTHQTPPVIGRFISP
ncbi:MAG: transcriptional repressor [Cylindrospermopsis raciborskii KL1]|uniref:Fur family transcriptional regulator n=1 Tax=Cylindrospermopsis raciborskii TaxID=77022 RepID=UPI001A32E9FE|nr:Fur family transcriptional regulator [Cylindrospermopsis raciborskii]MBG0744695.1 transcriptional repressor [Cylindrospermopsis raciborskii KL1]